MMSLIWILAGLISGILLWLELRLLPRNRGLHQELSDQEQSLGHSTKAANPMTRSV
ncbi:hypothetical protein ACFQ3J_04820 [Paenibacillus provencensis]|uniref:Uncharacterized protein n=1 Tax=Paenibacillus provencensis TaxID=441151 RepID=A0ABW3PUI6_9BACL|nr:hypothetical protein [Paenibacillus sp. MER 78]MCM3126980.1 hypothetical protein [Paenibacillus sp. MER 78]